MDGEGKVEEEMGGIPQLGRLDPPVEEGREGEKGKEGSLGWGIQALLFFTFMHCLVSAQDSR